MAIEGSISQHLDRTYEDDFTNAFVGASSRDPLWSSRVDLFISGKLRGIRVSKVMSQPGEYHEGIKTPDRRSPIAGGVC